MPWSRFDIGCCCTANPCYDYGQAIAPYADDFSVDTSADYYDWTGVSISGGVVNASRSVFNQQPQAIWLTNLPTNPNNLIIEVEFTISPTGIYTVAESVVRIAIGPTASIGTQLIGGQYLRNTTSGSNLDDYGSATIDNGKLVIIIDDIGGGNVQITRQVYYGATLELSDIETKTQASYAASLTNVLLTPPSSQPGCALNVGFGGSATVLNATIDYTFDNFSVDWS